MKTPKNYKEMLKNRTITKEMLEAALYSVNKRAKAKRDHLYDLYNCGHFNNKDAAMTNMKREMKYLYHLKYSLLTLLTPKAIHKEIQIQYKPISKKHHEIVEYKEEERIRYYLFYQMENHSFHHPVKKKELENWKNLKIIGLKDPIVTYSDELNNLLSLQFVRKIVALIKSGNYRYIDKKTQKIKKNIKKTKKVLKPT